MSGQEFAVAPSSSGLPISSFLPSTLCLVLPSRPSRPLPTLPLELQLLILKLGAQHRICLQLIDTERGILATYPFLRSACLVSKAWRVDATKLLFSHLVLPTPPSIESFSRTLETLGSHLTHTKFLSFRTRDRRPFPTKLEDSLFLRRGWPSLERLVTSQTPNFTQSSLHPHLQHIDLLFRSYPSLAPMGSTPFTFASIKRHLIPPPSTRFVGLEAGSQPINPVSAAQLRTVLGWYGPTLVSLQLELFVEEGFAVASPPWVFTSCPLLRTLFVPLDFVWPESGVGAHLNIERLVVGDPEWNPYSHRRPFHPLPSSPYDPNHLIEQMRSLIDKDVAELFPNLLSISLFPISFEDDEEIKARPALFFVLKDLQRLYPSIRLEDRLGTVYDPRWCELDGVDDEESGDGEEDEEASWSVEF